MPNMQFSLTFARWVVTHGKALIDHYYGVNFDIETGRFEQSELPVMPLEHELPLEAIDLRYWVNSAIMFIKTIVRIYHHNLQNDLEDIILPPDDLSIDTFDNDNEI